MTFVNSMTRESVRDLGPGAYLVSILPSAILVTSVLALASSRLYPGTPVLHTHGHDVERGVPSILETAKGLGASGWAVIVVLVLMAAVLMRPIQFAAIRLLEGYGSDRGGGVIQGLTIERHLRRFRIHNARKDARLEPLPDTVRDFHQIAQHGRVTFRAMRIRRRAGRVVYDYPGGHELIMSTLLGNILRKMETTAGERYGLETLLTYPRLFPYIGDRLKAETEVQLAALSTAATFVFVFAAETLMTVPLVLRPTWAIVCALFAVAALVAFRGAQTAARRCAVMVATAYDLHRFDMLRGLHRPLPVGPDDEPADNEELNAILSQAPFAKQLKRPRRQARYDHGSAAQLDKPSNGVNRGPGASPGPPSP